MNLVEFLVWLENDLFLACHVSTGEQPPTAKCHLITRQGQNFQFQQFTNPVDPFGSDKSPHHTVARLKDFPPNLQDLLVFSSTANSDIGLASRSKKAMTSDVPAEKITNVFTTTELADDSRRATLPMGIGDGMESPIVIGTALDLSGRDKVYKPIPTDELDESPGPLPGYWALNDEGVLSVWWVVYSESVRGGTTYPGLAVVEGNTPAAAPAGTSQPAQVNPFSNTTTSTFGSSAQSSTPAFGGPSLLGSKSSPWATAAAGGSSYGSSTMGAGTTSSAPAFGRPSFGTPSAPAFVQSSGLGTKLSPWASASSSGQSSFANIASGSGNAFGSASSNNAPSAGGFASFANKGGFAQISSNASANAPSIFASTSKSEAPEVSMETDSSTVFPPPSSKPNAGVGTPFGAQPFKLQSTFQRDPNAKDDDITYDDEPSSEAKSMFGATFGSVLGETTQSAKPSPFATATKSVFGQSSDPSSAESTTPTTTPVPSKFLSPVSTAPKTNSIFSFPSKDGTTPTGSFTAHTHTPTEGASGIKVEEGTPKPFRELPATPLPPESTSKATYPLGDSSSSSTSFTDQSESIISEAKGAPLPPDSPPAAADNAALPPDPVQNKKIYDVDIPPLPDTAAKAEPVDDAPLPPDPIRSKKVYDVEIPPLPDNTAKSKSTEDAPLPPDAVKQAKAYDVKFTTLSGSDLSPLSVLPAPKVSDKPFVFPSNPPPAPSDSDDDDELSEEGTEAATEGSGVDVAKDLSPSIIDINKTPGYTPQSSFEGLGGSFSTISRPDLERRGLFGEVGRNAPLFPRPNVISPRSPSPVRNAVASRLVGKDQARSFSTPAMASQILGAARRQQGGYGSALASKAAAVEDHIMEQQRKAKAKKQAEESQLLVDEDDYAIQRLLQSPVEPTLVLHEFMAHSGAAAPAGDSIPAQVEAVYRDINSMIDTVGLNARSLAGFIKGHQTTSHDRVTKYDLTSPDSWTLDEMNGLSYIIKRDLSDALHAAEVVDVGDKLARCAELQRELTRDRNKQADLKRIIASRLDPDQVVANRSLPLSAEQAAQQNDLRREFAHFTRMLAEVEENLTLLKAKIVSAGGGGAAGRGGSAPTIEAVVRTITKMTSMVEKRSGDIDVLENQMRKLRMGSAGASFGSSSREGSPFAGAPTTPNNKRLSASFALFSPDRSVREGTPQQHHHHHRNSILRHSVSGSIALSTPPRKKLSGFGDVEKAAVKEKRGRRAAVLGKLRSSLHNKGVSVWAVEDIE